MSLPAIRLSAVRGAAAISVAAVLLAGCGTSDRQQVHGKVEQFAVAVAHKDAKTICNQVFAPSLVEHFTSAGLTCVRGMGIFFSGLQNPSLALGPITVHGSRASVVTLSGASGQSSRGPRHQPDQDRQWLANHLARRLAAVRHRHHSDAGDAADSHPADGTAEDLDARQAPV